LRTAKIIKITSLGALVLFAAMQLGYEYHTASTARLLLEAPDSPLLWVRLHDFAEHRAMLAKRYSERAKKYSDIHHQRRTGYAWHGC